MSLRELVQGACGQINPVLQVASHFTQDLGLREGFGLAAGIGAAAAATTAAVGLGAKPQNHHVPVAPPTTFQMEGLLQEIQGVDPEGGAQSQNWTHEFVSQEQAASLAGAGWTGDFLGAVSQDQAQGTELLESYWTPAPAPAPLTQPLHQHQPQYHHRPQDLLDDSKWVSSVSLPQHSELQSTAQELLQSVQDPKIKATDFMKYVEKLAGPAPVAQAGGTPGDLAAQWANEYDFEFNQDQESGDFWQKMQDEWERIGAEEQEQAGVHPWLQDYEQGSASASAAAAAYQFTETSANNPFTQLQDPLKEGLRLLAAGDIPSAVLAFESAVRQEANSSNPQAWFLLGTTQAQNEQDPLAIGALRRALELDPGHLEGLLSLAASLTNESYHLQACQALLKWLQNNPKYSHLVKDTSTLFSPTALKVSSLLTPDQLSAVQRAFISAARLHPRGTASDPDVQSGLGILFNLSGNDYEKAADCFQAALAHRPEDALLWNRLGATLANGGRSTEAISAYRRALELSRGFVRTRYNLGISCVNLGAYREAAEHFLSALNQQAAGKSTGAGTGAGVSSMSDSIWTSLRMVLHLLDRKDLTRAIGERDLGRLNHEFGLVGTAGPGAGLPGN